MTNGDMAMELLKVLVGVAIGIGIVWLATHPQQREDVTHDWLPPADELKRMVRADARPGDGTVRAIPTETDPDGTVWALGHYCPTCSAPGDGKATGDLLKNHLRFSMQYRDDDGKAPWWCMVCDGRFESHELVTASQLETQELAAIARRRLGEQRPERQADGG